MTGALFGMVMSALFFVYSYANERKVEHRCKTDSAYAQSAENKESCQKFAGSSPGGK